MKNNTLKTSNIQTKISNINIYFLYTLIFAIVCLLVFSAFLINNKSFIWSTDGFKQHYVIFQNFNELFRNFGENLLNGSFNFSFELGLGLDVIGQYSYYILGDPFAYLSLLFPIDNLEFAYNSLIILRIFCVGISFICYSIYHKNTKYNTLVGALMYTFCGFILYASVRHPYFTNAAILLPLILLGIDKILKENKYIPFIIISAISAISNYYFFYMLTILAFIYAIVNYFNEYKKSGIKYFYIKFIKTFLAYIIGVMIAGTLLLPSAYAFLNSARTGTGYTSYDLNYYCKLFFMHNDNFYWARIYVPSIFLLILPFALYKAKVTNFFTFKKNAPQYELKKSIENRTILIIIFIETIILLIPFLGSVMNGFSFQSNRWIFGFSFYLCYLVTINLKTNLRYSKKSLLVMSLPFCLYMLLSFVLINKIGSFTFISCIFALAILFILILRNTMFKKNVIFYDISKFAIFVILCTNISWFAWNTYSQKNYINEFLDANTIETTYSSFKDKLTNFSDAINKIKKQDNSFYRIGTSIYESNNLTTKYHYNGLNTYLSIGNQYISDLSKDLLILNSAKTNPLRELDSRTQITTLLGCKYYILPSNKSNYIPYGYHLISDNSSYKIYENNYSLPVGIFYDNYITKSDYNKLSPLEKEQILLHSIVINKDLQDYDIQYNSDYLNDVECIDVNFELAEKNNSFKIKFDELQNCELYLYFENLEFLSNEEYTIKVKYNGISKSQVVRNKVNSPYYQYTPNILCNLGYSSNHSKEISVSFSPKGKYSFDNINLIAIPMDNYVYNIEHLKKSEFNLTDHSNTFIEGNISTEKDGILQFSVSFSDGWKAYVDDIETDIINTNTGFVGIPVSAGQHSICIKYSSPWLLAGIVSTFIGLACLAFWNFCTR